MDMWFLAVSRNDCNAMWGFQAIKMLVQAGAELKMTSVEQALALCSLCSEGKNKVRIKAFCASLSSIHDTVAITMPEQGHVTTQNCC